MPSSPLGFLTTELFSARTKLAVLREPFVPPRRDDGEESVAEFVTRRLNREFLDARVDPLVAGIFAGDPHKLSVQHAFPKLLKRSKNTARSSKARFSARRPQKTGEISRERQNVFLRRRFAGFDGCTGGAIGRFAEIKHAGQKLTQIENGWRVSTSNGEVEFGAVIYCGTAFKLAELKIESQILLNFSAFSEIRHPPVASVVLGFRREDVTHPLGGFGMLIPKIEGFKILGTIFSSSLFPNRAPENFVTLTSYIGGERQPELASLPADELVKLVCEDLRVLLGVKGRPVFTHHHLWPRAIPQYNVGYGKFKELMNEIEIKARGLFFAGSFRDGVSLGDSIVSGCNVVERAADFLKP